MVETIISIFWFKNTNRKDHPKPVFIIRVLSTAPMPRLNHRKSANGCKRCKRRKVKCDETRPECHACVRHEVVCEYGLSGQRAHDRTPSIHPPTVAVATLPAALECDRTLLELRLLHFFLLYTCSSFTTVVQFWKVRAPLVAFKYRPVFDGIMTLAALHLHRQTDERWRKACHDGVLRGEQASAFLGIEHEVDVTHEAFLGTTTSQEMLHMSFYYFQKAVEGHREALKGLQGGEWEAAYMASALISFTALFLLGGDAGDEQSNQVEAPDERLWFRLGGGPRGLLREWKEVTGRDVLRGSGFFEDEPDLYDDEELFKPIHAEPFHALLVWAREYEVLDERDEVVYQQTLSYIGLMYKGLAQGTEPALATSRRIIAAPSRLPDRFTELLLDQRPRALTMLAYIYALTRVIAAEIPWYYGIAEKQIPLIYERLPLGWKKLMEWPTSVLYRPLYSTQPLPEPPGRMYS